MASEKSASKTDAVVKVVIVFFVCLLSFSIGTFVGKKFSDSQHKIAKFEPGETPTRDVASAHEGGEEVKAGETLSDSEVANLAAEFVTDESETEAHVATGDHAGTHAATAEEKTSGHQVEAPSKEVVHEPAASSHEETSMKAAPKKNEAVAEHNAEASKETSHESPLAAAHHVAKNEAPSHDVAKKEVAETKPRLPSSLPKDVAAATTGRFTVQVVAKKSEDEAKKYAAELKEKGFAAFYVKANVKSETWYRVNIGLYATAQEAEANKKELLGSGKITSAIVQKVLE